MKPISLKLAAFGPYLEEQFIDFTVFYKSNLFLIHGETGSGKTVILDAMTYALYGKSSGGIRGDIAQMRCDRADNKADTVVEYEFSVRDVIYKFVRNIRCTSGGKLQVSQNALVKRGDIYEQLGENDKQLTVSNEAERIIGLNYDQFRQVIILPQGQFENFLIAKSDVKEAILNTLFNAEKWSAITSKLWEKSRAMESELTSEEQDIRYKLRSVQCDDIAICRERTLESEAKAAECTESIAALTKAQSESQVRLEHAKKINAVLADLAVYKAKLQTLTVGEADVDNKRIQYAVKPMYLAYMNAENEYKKRADDAVNTHTQYADACVKYESSAENLKIIEADKAVYDGNTKLLIRYNEMVGLYRDFEVRKQEVNGLRVEYYNISKSAENDEKKLRECTESRKQLSDEREYIIAEYSAALPELRQRADDLKESRKFILNREKSLGEIKSGEENLADKKSLFAVNDENLRQLKAEYQRKYDVYIANTAAILADELADGEPCPVCGSTHHPSPHGVTENDTVTAEHLKSLNDKISAVTDNMNSINAETEKINIRLQSLNESLRELDLHISESVPFTQVALTEADAKLRQADTGCGKLKDITDKIKNLDDEISGLSELVKSYDLKKAELKEKGDAAVADCKAMKQRMDDDITDNKALADKTAQLEAFVARYETAVKSAAQAVSDAVSVRDRCDENVRTTNAELMKAESEFNGSRAAYEEILRTHGFTDTEKFTEMLAESQSAADLDREIREYDKLHYNLTVNITELEESLHGETAYNVIDMTATHDEITNNLNDKITLGKSTADLAKHLGDILEDLEKRTAELEVRREKYNKLYTFASSLSGNRGIGLSRYVLGVMLTAVIHEANVLLQNVHGGRYSLRHTLDTHGRSQKAGLEIEVYDSYTDRMRWSSTLSGGEKFLVALTLSLGLSSVVQSQSGGIKIDAIFIDEGFGTLDPYSVEDALNILKDINVSRSMVGIISHVELLKDNIGASLEVEKRRNGSVLHCNKLRF